MWCSQYIYYKLIILLLVKLQCDASLVLVIGNDSENCESEGNAM